MFAYQHPDLPLHLDPARYASVVVGRDQLLPVCKPKARAVPLYRLPGTARQPLPHISYSETTYFARCFALLLSRVLTTPFLLPRYESEMADVLKRMALEGEGIAWLPRSLIASELASGALVSAGDGAWLVELELRAYRDSFHRDELIERLWSHLPHAGLA
jgi:DNA-binding transcriptional LysR family regulator